MRYKNVNEIILLENVEVIFGFDDSELFKDGVLEGVAIATWVKLLITKLK